MERGKGDNRTKDEIVGLMAKQRYIEDIIINITGEIGMNEKDLAQDLYVSLLEKDEEKIVKMWENGDIRWFVTRMVVNNIKSVNSRFYYQYLKDTNYIPINEIMDKV